MKKNNSNNIEVRIQDNYLLISKSEKQYKFELKKISIRLASATKEELEHFSISPSNYGIHWTLLDEDISIPALLNEPHEDYKSK